MRPKAIDVKPLENYEVLVIFDNGEKKIFDVKPYMAHRVFAGLRNKEMFKTVKVSGLSIEWANGADICPDELYYNSTTCNA